jgi:YD repeat-containing protein
MCTMIDATIYRSALSRTAFACAFASVLDLPGCNCEPDMVLALKDVQFFNAQEISSSPLTIRVSGLAFHSLLVVREITTAQEGDSLLVLVHLIPARQGLSGTFRYDLVVPDSVNKVAFGEQRTLIWDRTLGGHSLIQTGASGIQSLAFAYNANDAITTLTNSVDATLSQTFGYDELMRLTSVTSTSGNEAFTYDANGNRLTDVTGAGTATLLYLPGTNRLGSWTRSGSPTRSYGYDAAGNTIALLGKTYTYNPFNRLTKVVGGGSTTTYDVNALGDRLYKNANGVESFYAYAPDHTLLGDYILNVQRWSDILRVGGEPIALTRNNVLHFVHADQLGRPEAVPTRRRRSSGGPRTLRSIGASAPTRSAGSTSDSRDSTSIRRQMDSCTGLFMDTHRTPTTQSWSWIRGAISYEKSNDKRISLCDLASRIRIVWDSVRPKDNHVYP